MILASQSPRRRQLLEELGYELEVLPADIDEARREDEAPVALVGRLAEQKADASLAAARARGIADKDGLLVAADTIVWDDEGDVLGKPADAADAARMLRELSEDLEELGRSAFVETTDVEFWPLSDAQIASYVATGEPMDKAGAYGIQGLGRLLVRGIRGDYFSVVGLPVSRLARELEALTDR